MFSIVGPKRFLFRVWVATLNTSMELSRKHCAGHISLTLVEIAKVGVALSGDSRPTHGVTKFNLVSE
jgi:hypothetical protein